MSDFTVLAPDEFPGLVLVGELDIATAPALDAALVGLSGDVIVDCTDLGFIDSAGFYCLDRGYNAAVARQSTFEVSGFSQFQRRVARLLALPYVSGSGEAA
jgi:anti-anti-sigma regulatory factor